MISGPAVQGCTPEAEGGCLQGCVCLEGGTPEAEDGGNAAERGGEPLREEDAARDGYRGAGCQQAVLHRGQQRLHASPVTHSDAEVCLTPE